MTKIKRIFTFKLLYLTVDVALQNCTSKAIFIIFVVIDYFVSLSKVNLKQNLADLLEKIFFMICAKSLTVCLTHVLFFFSLI